MRSVKSYRDGWGALAAVVVFVGCAGPAGDGGAVVTGLPTLTLSEPIHHLDQLVREPMVVQHPGGSLFVSGYGSQVTGLDPRGPLHLWRSDDQGATWQTVDVGTPEDGAMGNSDVDLGVGPDGTLYFLAMGYDRPTFSGTHMTMGVSPDAGASWNWTVLSETRLDDRPWVGAAPDGTVHAIWNDGAGVSYAVSRDSGASWVEQDRVHDRGGSSHMAIGPSGEVAVRITPLSASGNQFDEDVELIAVSTDGGTTFQLHDAPGTRVWSATFGDPDVVPRWVEPLAWDEEGALHHLWSEGSELYLARSQDQGATWTTWLLATEQGTAFFPYLAAGPAGRLAATWFTTDAGELQAHVALIQPPESDDGVPDVSRAAPLLPDAWDVVDGSRTRSPAGEYLPVLFLSDGDLAVVSPIQNLRDNRMGFTWWRVELH